MEETNKIILRLEEYIGLRDFRRHKKNNKTLRIHHLDGFEEIYVIDDTYKVLAEDSKGLKDEIIKLRDLLIEKNDIFKNMSVWQFIKWRFEERAYRMSK